MDSNCYLVNNELLIDAGTGFHPKMLVQALHNEGIFLEDIKRIVLTHAHFDHAGGIHLFKNAKIGIHRDDAKIIESGSDQSMAQMFAAKIKARKADFALDDGDIIRSGEIKLKVIHTPGHTKGSICIYDEKSKMLFSGDTVFREGFGRMDLPGGNSDEMKKSLEKLSRLDVDILLPGHGEVAWGGGSEVIKRIIEKGN